MLAIFLLLQLAIGTASAQYYPCFNPYEVPPTRAPIDTQLTFYTTFTLPSAFSGPVVVRLNGFGIASPSQFETWPGEPIQIQVMASSHTVGCWDGMDGIEAWIDSGPDSGQAIGYFCVCNIDWYDPTIIGNPRVCIGGYYEDPHPKTDSIKFPAIDAGGLSLTWDFQVCDPDSFPVYRKFSAINVRSPFAITDTIPLTYPCPGTNDLIAFTGVSFRPQSAGHFVDTVFLADPLKNDSIPLILIGDGIAAGVSDNPILTALRLYPNPADRTAMLSLPDGSIQSAVLYDVLGDPVLRVEASGESSMELNTSSLPAGLYFLEARIKDEVYRERLIVNH